MFFTLRILCWTCTAKDLSLRDEIIFLMVCPRVIIWAQILIRPRELGPLGHFYRVLSSVQMCKFKNLIQIESNWVIFDWFSSRLLTWKWLSLDIIQVLQKPLPRHLERRVGSRLTQTWCHLYHRVGGSHDHGESRGHERHRSWKRLVFLSRCPHPDDMSTSHMPSLLTTVPCTSRYPSTRSILISRRTGPVRTQF